MENEQRIRRSQEPKQSRIGLAGKVLAAAGLTLGGISIGIESARTPAAEAKGPPVAGDVNCSWGTNSIDAALVLQRTAGITGELPCESAGDVNRDNILNAVDAALILSRNAGLMGEAPGKKVPEETATRTPEPTPTKDGCGEAAGIADGTTYVDVCATKAAQQTSMPTAETTPPGQ